MLLRARLRIAGGISSQGLLVSAFFAKLFARENRDYQSQEVRRAGLELQAQMVGPKKLGLIDCLP